ncbi:MAG TPA: nucleoside triphosphate pyrophosphohydrolase [Vicinamibacterales bacterium]|nr:nucleoside triphosphate pyrophosphohydrolase [Vicinamibacterales bacterium]
MPTAKRAVTSSSARAARAGRSMARLVRIMATLRSKRGCPWDREQTHASLRPFLLEETYEALEVLDRGDLDALPGELGDVMFQCVFHSQIAAEAGRFEMADALDAITAKLVRRHPHVFTPSGRPLARGRKGRGRLPTTPSAVLTQWEQIKASEQHSAGAKKRLLSGVPRALPGLLRAYEIGTRVAAVGFDWPDTIGVVDKIDEEVRELREALSENPERAAEELGDLLFSIANLARKLKLEPESALRAANEKFSSRFAAVEADLERRGSSVHAATTEEMEAAWQRVKRSSPPRTARSRSARAPRARRSR